jgi:cytochrome c
MNLLRIAFGWIALSVAASPAMGEGDGIRGARTFGVCAACHSMERGRHLTGPSLAGIWGRKAGTAPGFLRYSAALRRSGIVWDAPSLDAWLEDPEKAVPGNYMLFHGVDDARVRADLVAYLRAASKGDVPAVRGAPPLPDLKNAPSVAIVTALRHCGDTYFVTNRDGETVPYWEFNLRFKTDSSARGPVPGKPVIVSQGMRGDRAQVVFARFKDISAFIREDCAGP